MPGQVTEVDRRDQAFEQACRQVGLDPAGAELIRRGTNAVYRLASAPVIVRVAPEQAHAEDVARQVAVARWLAREEVPAVCVLDVDQPVRAAGHLVTLWESLGDGRADDPNQYGTTADLGAVLRQLHQLRAPASLHLPDSRPFRQGRPHIDQLRHVAAADREFLGERLDGLQALYQRLRFELPYGPIHGDANVGNLLRDQSGRAALSDLDGFRQGPREWDLVLTAMFAERYGWHTEGEYRDFVNAYGHDVRAWDGYPVLRDVRELSMVLWVAGNAARDEAAAAEFGKRVESLRTGRGREDWSPL